MSGLLTRKMILDLCAKIIDKRLSIAASLEQCPAYYDLSEADQKFVLHVTYSFLRYHKALDPILLSFLESGKPLTPTIAQRILLLGMIQIFYTHTPDHALVDTSVTLMKEVRLKHYAGIANAVLRKIIAHKDSLRTHIALEKALPDWLYHSWINDYGPETAQKITQASLNTAPIDITMHTSQDSTRFEDMLRADPLPLAGLRLRDQAQKIEERPGFSEGAWWVQDIAASLPIKLLGDLRGKKILDLCAAPGGKTAQLVSQGAQVTALDRSAKRMQILKKNMERLNFLDKINLVIEDALYYSPRELFDIVVIDAPCSATGTLRRHPEIIYHKTQKDVDNLVLIQEKLLHHAAQLCKKEGYILYMTCSLQKIEGKNQINKFMMQKENFIQRPFTQDLIPSLPELFTQPPYYRALPHFLSEKGGMDGFFAALIQKLD